MLARMWGCRPSEVLDEPAWAIETALALMAAEAEIAAEERRRWQRS
jgi:hypothetical protein